MSKTIFPSLARKYLTDMSNAQSSLKTLDSIFGVGKDVQCYHCNVVISSLTTFRKPVRSFDALLREVDSSPVSLSLNYYTLMISVDQIDDQEYQIRSMIDAYRPVCQLYSKQALKQKHEIQHALKKFVNYIDIFLEQVAHFINESQFLEKQQRTTSHEKQAIAIHTYHESDVVPQKKKDIIPIRAGISSSSF